MYTDINRKGKRIRSSRRRKRRKAGVLFTALLLTGLLFFGVFFLYRSQVRLKNAYSPADRTGTFDYGLAEPLKAEPFASGLNVVTKTSDSDKDVAAGSGLLCSSAGGESLYAKNAFARMNPASITKVMTCLLAIEKGNLSDVITAGPEVAVSDSGATLAGIKAGDKLTLEQLLYGLMLPSGADAANVLAVYVSGSTEKFTALMNERAAEIGATGTHFVNCDGLTDPDHYSTSYDLYLILHEAMKNEEFRKVSGTASYTASYTSGSGKSLSRTWKNTNQYLSGKAKEPSGLSPVGGKTGTTAAAGNCLALISRNGKGTEFYSIVLNAKTKDMLYANMNVLLEKITQ